MSSHPASESLIFWAELSKSRVNQFLDPLLPKADSTPQKFNAALRYTLANGGKKLRPMLVYITANMLGGSLENADAAASAVELIHTYSLVHDDLPAMDDDDLRRGKPSCHCAFDEATAILAGDALQALAFEVLATPCSLPAKNQLNMVRTLAQASGLSGMCKGQALDIEATQKSLTVDQLKEMHEFKTGALIKASIILGAYASGKASEEDISTLSEFADYIGLAFQVKDDILDVIGDTASLGKPQGSDEARGKSTYTSLLGLENAINYATNLCEHGKKLLETLKYDSMHLVHITDYINQRVT